MWGHCVSGWIHLGTEGPGTFVRVHIWTSHPSPFSFQGLFTRGSTIRILPGLVPLNEFWRCPGWPSASTDLCVLTCLAQVHTQEIYYYQDSWICLNQTFLGLRLGKLFPARESLVSDIPAEDRNTANPFLQCTVLYDNQHSPSMLVFHDICLIEYEVAAKVFTNSSFFLPA